MTAHDDRTARHHLPKGYKPFLDVRETEAAIRWIKERFQTALSGALNLSRVSAPPALTAGSGVNDYLNGIEQPVSFTVKDLGLAAEVVQSLAKWKRLALAEYGFAAGEGLYTDMNALRPDEALDNLHSVFVDQWDWERVITARDRTLAYLGAAVRAIYAVIRDVEAEVCARHPVLPAPFLPPAITMVSAQELEDRYPGLDPRERENAACREHGAVFVSGIGARLRGGAAHDGRAPDYDDWSTVNESGGQGLNGDIIVWYPVLGRAFELSSMGIRVDAAALERQLAERGVAHYRDLPFHRRVLDGSVPPSIGGGIGQSRLCMMYMRKAHIGEVQVGIWPFEVGKTFRENGVTLL